MLQHAQKHALNPLCSSIQEKWSPSIWRFKDALQQPTYPDHHALYSVEEQLKFSLPLVSIEETLDLKSRLSDVAQGRGFLLQGGDCAESFSEFSTKKIEDTLSTLSKMSSVLTTQSGLPVVSVGRLAGQLAKPRSSDYEVKNNLVLPSYRGDMVNGIDFSEAARLPNPERMMDAYQQSAETLAILKRFSLDLAQDDVFASHESLLLPYEEALTRQDGATWDWHNLSGHMLWIGDRTRQLDGAHVAFLEGVQNPIGLKCGPSLTPGDLCHLVDRLNPSNDLGRLTLIVRFGADEIRQKLPPLVRAIKQTGKSVVWSCDPMHGNTYSSSNGYKTRHVKTIIKEIDGFFDICTEEGVHPGGLHLEMTGQDVTECVGGRVGLKEEDLGLKYETHCDPRLNASQSLEVASMVAGRLKLLKPKTTYRQRPLPRYRL